MAALKITKGRAAEVSPPEFLFTRTHQIWPSAMCYEGILNVDTLEGGNLVAHLAGKTLGLAAH